MTTPESTDPEPEPARLSADPTIRVARPPGPGPAKRAEVADAGPSTPHAQPDEPTVGLPGQAPIVRQRTLQFGTPSPVKVTVGPRPRPKRRFRTWPWIAAVALALVVLGAVLLVMLLRGATIDGGTDLLGSDRSLAPESTVTVEGWPSGEDG
jgi:hypothetical protein